MLEDSENHDLADDEGDGSNDLKNSLADASHITPPPVTPQHHNHPLIHLRV
ncbi:hypothetical protein GO730_28480 [Spirosoma sp. HMF3257]|uniref:hypothetical protein n=1 Tax=Spirosoma telluris TaxID=2183553 RepID=UPI0012F8CEBE|nr:hypothetical protein [Spirosoma telluris]